MIAAHHNILAVEHSVQVLIFLLLCISPIDLRALPGVKQWPPVAPPEGSRSAIQPTTIEISERGPSAPQHGGNVTRRQRRSRWQRTGAFLENVYRWRIKRRAANFASPREFCN
uniref:Putative secreted protein n=1 Tax=Ixodes ricinus TaxID=34613 RepID=A0A6B0UKJ5_IXORI